MAFDKLGDQGAAGSHPSDGRRHVRRRPSVTIDTERQFVDGLVTAGGVHADAAAAHIATQRARRLRKGDIFLRRCLLGFMLALSGVLKTRQYSVEYYVSWVLAYLSFFFM